MRTFAFLLREYDLVRARRYPTFRGVRLLLRHHGRDHASFYKYRARYLASGGELSAGRPQKRSPKWRLRRPEAAIEAQVEAQPSVGWGATRSLISCARHWGR